MTWAHCLVYLSLSFVSCFMGGGGQEYPLLGLAPGVNQLSRKVSSTPLAHTKCSAHNGYYLSYYVVIVHVRLLRL